jgi:hypothetical protein
MGLRIVISKLIAEPNAGYHIAAINQSSSYGNDRRFRPLAGDQIKMRLYS